MYQDPVVAEVRRIKEEHAARYAYDVRAIAAALREEQEKGGRKVVSLPARRLPAQSRKG